ncbi:MAG: hypothetical protein M1822_003277 [Bathelium mastoideum]|nr:MAG: hypothetical protein M1822_003277 [Bathelium mastoideum]
MKLLHAQVFLGCLASCTFAAPTVLINQVADLISPESLTALDHSSLRTVDPFHQFDTQRSELLSFHRLLVEAESVTGNEFAVGTALAAYLKSSHHGALYNIETQRVGEKRYNILAYSGTERDADILVTSHIDTVPPFIPYTFHLNRTHVSSSLITGRGTVDAKGSVAAQVFAVSNILRQRQSSSPNSSKLPSIALLFVVGEETGGDGMRAANDLGLTPHTVIFGEPTEGKLASGHKGSTGFTVHVKGKAAHSGYPWLGVSANEVLVEVITAVKELENVLPASDKFGNTTINVGLMEGGVAANVVAEEARARFAVRIASGTPEKFQSAVMEAVNGVAVSYPTAEIDVEFAGKGYGPINIDHDVKGFESLVVNYGTDIPNLDVTVKGQKRYLYGPGSILVAHGKDEGLTVGQLEQAVKDYEKLILESGR